VSDTVDGYKFYTNDTLFSRTIRPEDIDREGTPDFPDSASILAFDTVNKVMAYLLGTAYIAWYDSSNKGEWPFPNNWISWRIFDGDNNYIDQSEYMPFTVTLGFVRVSGKKLLQVDWHESTGGNRVWTYTGGTQLWDLKTKTCYLDLTTYENIEASGAGTETGEGWNERWEIDLKVKNNKLVVVKNTDRKYPAPGKYSIKGKNLVREK
jgi:hypothetical protein